MPRHYQRRSATDRMHDFIHPESNSGCWLWVGSLARGYGKIAVRGDDGELRLRPAHRFVWETLVGAIPKGMELDHLCRTRCCVNPAHLEPVTHRENIRRGSGPMAARMAQVKCIREHALEGENLYITPDGRRQCRLCGRERTRRHNQKVGQ